MDNGISPEQKRLQLLSELEARYCKNSRFLGKLIYLRKRYAWLFVVTGTKGLKRLFDLIVAFASAIFFAPLMLLIAIGIKAYDGGAILYIAPRVGRYGKEFPFLKFRSMHVDADKRKKTLLSYNQHVTGVTFKMPHDPRITPLGKWLRRSSLDELPQLWNVIIGHMSLVGPRPPLPEEVKNYTLYDRRRLDTLPGITCLWQVGGRSDIPFPQQVSLDLQYIESQSFWLDFKILLQTIPAILLGKGAY